MLKLEQRSKEIQAYSSPLRSGRRLPLLVALTFLIASFSDTYARPQDSQSSANLDSRIQTQRPPEGDLRSVYVTVMKKDGAPLTDLKKEDFTLFENGAAQEIVSVAPAGETPVSAALLVDVSGSAGSDKTFETKMKMISTFAASAIRESDRVFVMVFGLDSRIVTAPTIDSATLQRALMLASRVERRGATSLYDALIMAAEELDKDKVRRKIVLLLTDFEDNTSRNSLERVIPRLQETETAVYPLLDVNQNNPSRRGTRMAVTRAQQVARESGGIQYSFDSPAGLEKVLIHLQQVLRDSYILNYRSAVHPKRGKVVQLNIKAAQKDVEILASHGRK
jgi:Ca-activated chloride channel family protein